MEFSPRHGSKTGKKRVPDFEVVRDDWMFQGDGVNSAKWYCYFPQSAEYTGIGIRSTAQEVEFKYNQILQNPYKGGSSEGWKAWLVYNRVAKALPWSKVERKMKELYGLYEEDGNGLDRGGTLAESTCESEGNFTVEEGDDDGQEDDEEAVRIFRFI